MRVTKVDVTIPSSGYYLGYVSLVLDNAYTLNGVRITRRADGGLQVLYPHLAEREGKRRQIFAFKPMNPIAHNRIEQAVLSAYKEELRKTGSTSGF